MVVSLTACGRESVGTPGGELENGVAAIEDAMTTKPNESSSASTTPIDDLRDGSTKDTVATPGDFPDAYNFGSGKISDYSRTAMLQKMPEPAGNNTVLNTAADPANIQVLYLWEEGNVPARTKFTQDMTGYFDDWNFRPYVTAIPVREGVKPKGAVVLMAGGAYQFRGNYTDSLPTAAALRELGFQTFIVDYRLSPYTQEEGALDVARAVRFVRKNAEIYGIDPDDIAVMGFSAGGIQAGEFLMHYDEDVTGTALDSTYVPDELAAPIKQGDVVGTVTLTIQGEVIGTADLIAGSDVSRNQVLYTLSRVSLFFSSTYFKVVIALTLFVVGCYGIYIAGRVLLASRKTR